MAYRHQGLDFHVSSAFIVPVYLYDINILTIYVNIPIYIVL